MMFADVRLTNLRLADVMGDQIDEQMKVDAMRRNEIMRLGRAGLLVACASFAALAVAVGPASAGPSTKDRVEILESEVAGLKSAAEAARASATRVDQLEREVRSLTGRIEELSFELDRANARIYSLTQAVSGDAALTQGEPGFEGAGVAVDDAGGFGQARSAGGPAGGPTVLTGPAGGSPLEPPAGAAPADDVQLPIDPDAAFEYANGFLFQEDLPRAEAAFSLFVSAFGGHPRAADAKYRLGEVLLAQDKFADAADAFVAYIRSYPDEVRVPEAYLKLSASFAGLGETGEACKVLKAAKAKYAGGDPRYGERANAALGRTGCPS